MLGLEQLVAVSRYFLGDLWCRQEDISAQGSLYSTCSLMLLTWELHCRQTLYKPVPSLSWVKVIIKSKIYMLLLKNIGCGMVQWFVHIFKKLQSL